MAVPWDKIGEFLKSDTAKNIGKAALSFGAGALERKRSEKERKAGLAEKRAAFEEQFGEGKKAFEEQLEKLRKAPSVTQRTEDLIQAQKEAGEADIAAAEKRGQERRSDIVSALQSGDPRSAAGLLSALEKYDAGEADARLRGLEKKAGAEAIGAAQEEEGRIYKRGLEKELMDRAGISADEARKALLDVATAEQQAKPAAQADAVATGSALYSMLKDYDFGNPGGGGGDGGEDPGKVPAFLDFLGGLPTQEYGGKIKYEDGGYMGEEGFKTKGEFSHKTNKKAVIDEENGEKEAELTGGEVVFNPKQTKDMEKLIEQGDASGLLDFMKELLSKPQFQD